MSNINIGLIGRIGSGKSTAASFLKSLGALIISADEINRELIKPGEKAYKLIVQNFGYEILNQDKTINTNKLRTKMLDDSENKAFLENLLHPMVRQKIKTKISSNINKHHTYCVIEIPFVIQKEDYPYFNKILCIDSNKDLQLARIMHKKTMSLLEANQIISIQAPREEYIQAADDTIKNEGSLLELESTLKKLHEKYCAM